MNPLPEFRFLNDKCEELEEKLKLAVEALEELMRWNDDKILGWDDFKIKRAIDLKLEQIKKGD